MWWWGVALIWIMNIKCASFVISVALNSLDCWKIFKLIYWRQSKPFPCVLSCVRPSVLQVEDAHWSRSVVSLCFCLFFVAVPLGLVPWDRLYLVRICVPRSVAVFSWTFHVKTNSVAAHYVKPLAWCDTAPLAVARPPLTCSLFCLTFSGRHPIQAALGWLSTFVWLGIRT